jgi:hypothetical protein
MRLELMEEFYDDEINRYVCEHCGKTYKKPTVLLRHHMFECDEIEERPCPDCPFESTSQADLMKHIQKKHMSKEDDV